MTTFSRLRSLAAGLAAILTVLSFTPVSQAADFTFLQPTFTQEIFGVAPSFIGGIAFAPDGDVWADMCSGSGGAVWRFDRQSTILINGTTIHPLVAGSPFASGAGCGLTQHPDGSLYTNTIPGVVRLSASTGAPTGGPFGGPGNALGITPDPQTGNLVYVGSQGDILFVDNAFATSGIFSSVTNGNFVDGLFFDPTGNFLFCSNRSPLFRLTILDRNGNLVQHVPMSSEPDGIAFHGGSPAFVVTSNTDGSMTRFDFPGNNYTQVPVQSVFASGGFRGDLSQVGSDGCLYLSQNGTHYDNGTITGENSVCRICPGFNPPVSNLAVTPDTATNFVGQTHTVTATATRTGNVPLVGQHITFAVISGPNAGASGACSASPACNTDAAGQVSFGYVGAGGVGTDVIEASFTDSSGVVNVKDVTKTWLRSPNSPPVCAGAFASQSQLWPPNHSYRAISILGVTDPDSGNVVTITVTSITQDEPTNTRGDGNTCPDAQIVNGQASVRAERTGTPSTPGNGRVYAIGFVADDGHGGQCTDTVYVCVPHDQGHPTCTDDGQRYNSLGPCQGGNQLNLEQASLAIGDVSNGQAHLSFALPVDGPVEIAAFDIAGRRLATIVSEVLPSGSYERDWNMAGLSKGMYFVRIQAGGVKLTRTLIKLH